jgi:hypothetical protein
MGPRPGAGILPSPQSSALGAPIGGGSAVLERQQKGSSFVRIVSAREGAYANTALFISLVRKLIDKGIISKEEMSGIVDEAGALCPKGIPLRYVRRFKLFVGSGRTSGSKVRQRKAKMVLMAKNRIMAKCVENDPNRIDYSTSQNCDWTCTRCLFRLVEFRSAGPISP